MSDPQRPGGDAPRAGRRDAPEASGAALETAPAGPVPPADANALRGRHFRALVGRRRTWLLVGVPALMLGVLVATASLVLGVIALLAVVAVGIGVVFAIADSKAADDFFDVFAAGRGLELGGKSKLPAATPLLRKGDDRYAKRTLRGEIAPGVDGMLALYTYEEQTTDSNGNSQTSYHEYTLGMTELPECVENVPELYCQRRFGLRSLEAFEDVFRRSKKRVTLESEALGDRYEIFVRKGQDEIWLRRLFSPSFIVWLAESAPDTFAFELVGGTLVADVKDHKEDAADLDGLAAATGVVAERLRTESLETGA